jgi:hypothetical protein
VSTQSLLAPHGREQSLGSKERAGFAARFREARIH